jgi:hypothetical protein
MIQKYKKSILKIQAIKLPILMKSPPGFKI